MTPYTDLRKSPRRSPEELLALPFPLALFIESTNVCNFKCPICTQSDPQFAEKSGYYKHMTPALFEQVIRQLIQWKVRPKVMRFYGIGEPLLNRRLHSMIVLGGTLVNRTEISTNGMLLAERAYELIQSGLDYVRVSVYHTDNYEYRRESGSRFTADDVLNSVRKFRTIRDRSGVEHPRICAKLTTSEPDWETFQKQYAGVADDLQMEIPYNWGSTKGRLVQLVKDPAIPRKVCPKPFFEMMVKANGDVSACCVDWAGQLNLGNVQTHTLKEIWEGPELRDIRQAHLSGHRFDLPACSNCNLPEVTPGNMDSLIGINLARLEPVCH